MIQYLQETWNDYKQAKDEIAVLRVALQDAATALYNGFEPNNQSRAYHRAMDALKRKL